jgi:long-chain acyl-CoA synthetase
MSKQPWIAEYQKWNVSSNLVSPHPDATLAQVIEEKLSLFAQRTAFIFLNQKFSFKTIDDLSRKLAYFLQQQGIEVGSRVAVMLPNIIQYPIATFAILRAGYILVNVNPQYTQRELYHQLQDSGARVLIALNSTLEKLQDIGQCSSLTHLIGTQAADFVLNSSSQPHIAALPNGIQVVDLFDTLQKTPLADLWHLEQKQQDTVILQYTGGTTGLSKGAELSHANILFNVAQNGTVFNSRFGDRTAEDDESVLCALPLYHIYGFTICLFSYGLARGFPNILIPNPRDLESLIDQYQQYRPTVFPAVNTLFNALAHHPRFVSLDHSHLKTITGGGAKILKATADLWLAVTGRYIYEGYGLSETSPTATFNPPLSQCFNETIGLPVPGTEIVILDEQGQQLDFNQAGEIAIRGPQVMKGYWQQPEATNQVFTQDGYFLSGDIGLMNEQGYITVLDRKKDMILVSGFNVYPNEIEYVLSLHPKVLESAVIGIEDQKSGQVPKAFIVKKDPSLTQEEIHSYLKQQLTNYKIPKYLQFVQELPKSAVGKILRRELPRDLDDNDLAQVS